MSGGPSLAASLRVAKTNCIWYSWGKKENWATETREGGKENGGQPFPQLYQIRLVLVTFRRLRCVFFWVACPLPGKLARVGGHRRQPVLNPAMHKASDAGHIGPHGMRRCLSFSYKGTCPVPPTPPRGKKAALFWRVLDVHKTSQVPSKMALGRGRFGARGGSPKKLNTTRIFFSDFLIIFDVAIFWINKGVRA